MTTGLGGHERAALELVRELGRSLVAHRLYPDDPEQTGFVSAADRVREAARVALGVGAVRFGVRAGAFVVGDIPLSGGEQVERLARECFERRVEELEVRSLPDANDVFQLCRVLSMPPPEVAEAGGAQALLREGGVWAIAAGEIRPDAGDHGEILASLPPELAEVWSLLGDPERLVTNLLVAGLHPNPAEAAQELFRRFGSLHDALPEDVVGRTGTLRRMGDVIDLLPEGVRREFFATVVTRMRAQAFASNYVNDLTDHDLVTQLLRLGATEGPELADIAASVISETGRPPTLFPMLAERLRERSHEEATAAPSIALIDAGEDGSTVRAAVADAVADRLVDEASSDLRELRDLYPSRPEDQQIIARLAFRDYVRSETQFDQLERALEGWTTTARQVLRGRDRERLTQLLDVVDLEGGDRDKRRALDRARNAVVDPEVVAELVEPSDDVAPLVQLLEPFGRAALTSVVDVLAQEEDQARRAYLVGVAVGLAQEEDVAVLGGRLDDPRWFVVRNVATILGRLHFNAASPYLVPLLQHPEPAVRREAVRAVVQSDGIDAVTHVRRVVRDPDGSVRRAAIGALAGMRSDAAARVLADVARRADDHGDQQRALELLAQHQSETKGELLRELASRRSRPRLPRSLRRVARAALRRLERGS